jgi:hypothetical protein
MWPLAKCGFTLDLFTGIIEFFGLQRRNDGPHCRGFFTSLEVKPQQRCAVACADRALVAEIDFQSALFVRSAVAGRVDVQSFLLDVSEKPAEPAVAAALQVATGIPVICLDQVRGWEGRPVLQSQSWFHPRLNLSGHTNGTK